MKCPVCSEQTLETLTTAVGSFERCPNCQGIFIRKDLFAAASQDRDKCLELLSETEALLLPTDKWCPKCLQKLFDGRIKSRGLICTLCPVCNAFWTNLPAMGQLEEAIVTTIRLQMDAAGNPVMGNGPAPVRLPPYYQAPTRVEPVDDSSLGQFFRAFARLFDSCADFFSGQGPKPASAKPKVKPDKVMKPVKKPLILEVQPPAPAPKAPREPPVSAPQKVSPPLTSMEKKKDLEPLTEAPSIDIPNFVFPEDAAIEELPVFKSPEAPVPEPFKPEPIPEVILQPEPVAPAPEPAQQPPVLPEVIPETPVVSDERDEEAAELLRLVSDDLSNFPPPELKPVPKPVEEVKKPLPAKAPPPAPKPEAPKPLAAKPVEKRPPPQPSSKGPGFFATLKAAWSPAPKKVVKPPVTTKPGTFDKPKASAAPIPVPQPAAAKPMPVVKPAVELPQPVRQGFFSKLISPKKPVKKPVVQPPISASAPVPAPAPKVLEVKPKISQPVAAKPPPEANPAVKPPKPAGGGFFSKLFSPKKPLKKPVLQPPSSVSTPVPVPVVKAPLPAVKKLAPTPKPKRAKVPSTIDHFALWPPWILGVVAGTCSAFRDFGFEPLPAALWALAGWAIGFMVRLVRLYPFQSFEETDLNELSGRKGPAFPVILKGRIVPADEQNPKGEVIFKQEEKSLRLNPVSTLDIIPRLFGLSNPRQLLQGDVALRGWYRPGAVPALEVQEVRTDKASRKSIVKSLRWATALSLLALAVIVSLALE